MLFTEPTISGSENLFPFKRLVTILFVVAGLSTAFVCAAFPLAGHWLVHEDPIHHADAIAVLAGNFPGRVIEAVQLYHNGYAPEVWLTQPVRQIPVAGIRGAVLTGEDILNFKVLCAFGVPAEAIRILDAPTVNTADELNAIDSRLKENGDDSVIVVTNRAHTRRVSALWGKYHFGGGQILLHAVSDDPFSPSHWWQSSGSRGQAIHEFLGMINIWAGMPVHRPLVMGPAGTSAASAASSAETSASGSD